LKLKIMFFLFYKTYRIRLLRIYKNFDNVTTLHVSELARLVDFAD